MKEHINTLIESIKEDYINYKSRNGTKELSDINKEMISEFCENITYSEGKKYIKIIKGGYGSQSVWGFVVNVDNDKKFRKGDILKAASWATPARNKARGNILDNDFSWVKWTGPGYLS